MEIPFKTLSDNARIWIYPSNRKLSDNEVIEIKELCSDFLTKWTSHNNTLLASFDIPYNSLLDVNGKKYNLHYQHH